MPHLYDTNQAVTLINNARMTLYLSTLGTKGKPKMRKHNCVNTKAYLCPPQKGKRDYMNTKEYRLLAQISL